MDDRAKKCIVPVSSIKDFDSNDFDPTSTYLTWWEPPHGYDSAFGSDFYKVQVLLVKDTMEEIEALIKDKRIRVPKLSADAEDQFTVCKNKRIEKNTDRENLKEKKKNTDAAAKRALQDISAQSLEKKRNSPVTAISESTLQSSITLNSEKCLMESKDKVIALLESSLKQSQKDCQILREKNTMFLNMNAELQTTLMAKVQMDSMTVNYIPDATGQLVPNSSSTSVMSPVAISGSISTPPLPSTARSAYISTLPMDNASEELLSFTSDEYAVPSDFQQIELPKAADPPVGNTGTVAPGEIDFNFKPNFTADGKEHHLHNNHGTTY